jgi:hypothetical protein
MIKSTTNLVVSIVRLGFVFAPGYDKEILPSLLLVGTGQLGPSLCQIKKSLVLVYYGSFKKTICCVRARGKGNLPHWFFWTQFYTWFLWFSHSLACRAFASLIVTHI